MIHRQPNSHRCFACGLQNPSGLRLTFFDNGIDEVWCEYTIPEQHQGYPGVGHGGIVATLLDELCGRTPMIADPNHFMMTVKIEVKYRQPAPLGKPLKATARLVKGRGRLAQAHAELRQLDGLLIAEAEATLADLPESFNAEQTLDELGWKVYE